MALVIGATPAISISLGESLGTGAFFRASGSAQTWSVQLRFRFFTISTNMASKSGEKRF